MLDGSKICLKLFVFYMSIKRLSETTINRIAAGEVLERPSSAIKELVENSIDAGASKIEVRIKRGGKNLISVSDNGYGMSTEDMWLALDRHTTSKLDEEDITRITNFGFRGEALPSIASVSRMKIESNPGSDTGFCLTVEGGEKGEFETSGIQKGTRIEVRDLFFATPARLKFLKTDKTEASNCIDILKKIALVHPHVSITLENDDKRVFKYRAHDNHNETILEELRLREIMGEKFMENALGVSYESEKIKVKGYVSLPTYNKATSNEQFLFVNDRPVRDKLLLAAVKVAYSDFLAKDRHPVVVIDLRLDPEILDVNVHPTKSEVRFNEPGLIRNIVIKSIKESITSAVYKASNTVADEAMNAARPEQTSFAGNNILENTNYSQNIHRTPDIGNASNFNNEVAGSNKQDIQYNQSSEKIGSSSAVMSEAFNAREDSKPYFDSGKNEYSFSAGPGKHSESNDNSHIENSYSNSTSHQPSEMSEFKYSQDSNSINSEENFSKQGKKLDQINADSTSYKEAAGAMSHLGDIPPSKESWSDQELKNSSRFSGYPLGAACAQLHETYIVSQNNDAIFIIDQHAAHERLVYEEVKSKLSRQGIARQRLLIPEIVEFNREKELQAILTHAQHLAELGLVIESFGNNSVIAREIPSLLGDINVASLVKDVATHLEDIGENVALSDMIKHVTETYACHHSIRSGRKMNLEEMNRLLREMENTSHSGQCNHGRPTYVELKLKDIEKLFGRR